MSCCASFVSGIIIICCCRESHQRYRSRPWIWVSSHKRTNICVLGTGHEYGSENSFQQNGWRTICTKWYIQVRRNTLNNVVSFQVCSSHVLCPQITCRVAWCRTWYIADDGYNSTANVRKVGILKLHADPMRSGRNTTGHKRIDIAIMTKSAKHAIFVHLHVVAFDAVNESIMQSWSTWHTPSNRLDNSFCVLFPFSETRWWIYLNMSFIRCNGTFLPSITITPICSLLFQHECIL